MCGIAGIFAYHSAAPTVDRDELRTIRDHMLTRGPDGYGEWFSGHGRVGLAHRRLAIIDLSERGAQPMVSAEGNLVVSFNGEIYNYRALRQSLEANGCVFHSDSDTEILLHLYAVKGEAMLEDLRGMFAFALWDARKQALLLARDPYGIKPLYVADDGWTVRFASQVKALLTSPRVSRLPEPAGLAGFYLFGSVPEPYTLYQEIRAVPAGAYVWVYGAGPCEPVSYCSIARIWAEAEETPPVAPRDLPALVREAVLDSVRHHLIADVPVGAFLSAGIDSGALIGLIGDARAAVRQGGEASATEEGTLQTLTLAFEEFRNTNADEAPLAQQVARHYGVDHRVRIVGEAEFQADLPRILAAMDQPSIDGINTWFISKATKEAGIKVAVSGVGGDELFGGYPSFRDIPRWMHLLWLPGCLPGLGALADHLQVAFSPLFRHLNPKAAGMLRYGGKLPGAYLLRRGLFLPRDLPDLLGKDLAEAGLMRLQPLRHIESRLVSDGTALTPRSNYGRIATLEAALYMRNQLLRDTDWASMAHSLEVRTPLVDIQLLKALAGPLVTARGGVSKHLLAESPACPLPKNVVDRAKTGFTTPIASWQQRGDSAQVWKQVPSLDHSNCPWARRWGRAVIEYSL